MAQPAAAISSARRCTIGVATELVTSYGRSILSGVIGYANLQRNWVLHKDMWRVDAVHWPDCDGIILGGVKADMLADVRAHARHLVTCSGGYDPADMPVVCLDDDATGAMAAAHLVEKGLKHFAFYGPVWAGDPSTRGGVPHYSFTPAIRRARGFHAALRHRGFGCANSTVAVSFESQLTHAHHPELLAWVRSLPKPVGVMASDDALAGDLAEACRVGDVAVPDEVAIVGVNNDELLCEGAWPPLTSVECNFARMGYLAAKLMDRLLKGEAPAADERLVRLPPVRVQQRMSTDVLAISQPEVVAAIRYIREHACEPCSVDDVLRAVPVSRRTLERQFASRMGRTLHDEIARVRLDTARRLLVQPDLPIGEVAGRCGFAAVQSFIRFFGQSEGVTPAAFRRRSLTDPRPAR